MNRVENLPLDHWFWSRLAPPDANGCMLWTGALDKDGYGKVKVRGKVHRANRVAVELFYGVTLPAGVFACHACDNPACCNPHHLWSGHNRENQIDSVGKGRQRGRSSEGLLNPRAKISPAHVGLILERLVAGHSNTAIGRDFGITHSNVSAIRRGLSWAKVPVPGEMVRWRLGEKPGHPTTGKAARSNN